MSGNPATHCITASYGYDAHGRLANVSGGADAFTYRLCVHAEPDGPDMGAGAAYGYDPAGRPAEGVPQIHKTDLVILAFGKVTSVFHRAAVLLFARRGAIVVGFSVFVSSR